MRTVYYMRTYVCPCGTTTTKLTDAPWDDGPCEACHALVTPRQHKEVETVKNIHPCHVARGRSFPYLDECLNTVVKSPSHKAQLLKQHGLTQVDSVHDRGDRPTKWRS